MSSIPKPSLEDRKAILKEFLQGLQRGIYLLEAQTDAYKVTGDEKLIADSAAALAKNYSVYRVVEAKLADLEKEANAPAH